MIRNCSIRRETSKASTKSYKNDLETAVAKLKIIAVNKIAKEIIWANQR